MAGARGKAAGLPQEEWPQVVFEDRSLQSVYNDPGLAEKMIATFKNVLGENRVLELSPVMYGEDFGWYGRVSPEIPILIYGVGSVHPEQFELLDAGTIGAIPSTHSSRYIPDLTPTLRTGILTMSSAVLELTRISHRK
jgi:metal-dependent amidase/aminoacylase/carboxypeptidase family protein